MHNIAAMDSVMSRLRYERAFPIWMRAVCI
jgi:hypothetical protein